MQKNIRKRFVPSRSIGLFLRLTGGLLLAGLCSLLPVQAELIQGECTLIPPDKYIPGDYDHPFIPARWCPTDEAEIAALKNPIEHAVCSDKGLSNLDERLNRAYEQALEASAEPEKLKAAQRGWLRQRNQCAAGSKLDIDCLWRRYEVRLYELTKTLPPPACASDAEKASLAAQPCPEAEFMPNEAYKAGCLKNWLAKLPPLKSAQYYTDSDSPAFCAAIFEAFKNASPEIEYVEPVVRISEALHPALARYRKCGHEWYDERECPELQRACTDNDYVRGDYRDYYFFDYRAHGFRLYRLDLDGNPKNGLEEYLYIEEHDVNAMQGKVPVVSKASAYVQLKLPPREMTRMPAECKFKDYLPATAQRRERMLNATSGINALIRFRGEFYGYNAQSFGNFPNIQPHGIVELYQYDRKKKEFSIVTKCAWNEHGPY